MRLRRAVVPPLGGLLAGYAGALVGAFGLPAAVPTGDLLWNVVSPWRIAAWMLESAHGVPLVVRSAAGIRAPDAPGSVGRLSELLGGGEDVVFTFSVVLVPISLLAITGVTVALLVRRARPASANAVIAWSVVSATVHGLGLFAAAVASSYEFIGEGKLAPDIGLGDATGHIGVGLGSNPWVALAIGAAWGAAFAAAGGLSSLRLRSAIASDDRVVLRGWMRGLRAAVLIVVVALVLGATVGLVTGRTPPFPLVLLGGYLLAANVVAAGIIASHGVPMTVALDAGPFTGWERVDVLNVGTSGEAAPPFLWLLALIPIAAGVVAGRFVHRRSSLSSAGIALRFGALWGLSLALLALLLRVRVLSSFSVGALDLGGGSAAFDPLVALVLGFGWGSVAAFAGAHTAREVGPGTAEPTWTCAKCGISNADDDRYCLSCGAGRPVPAV